MLRKLKITDKLNITLFCFLFSKCVIECFYLSVRADSGAVGASNNSI